MSSSPQQKVVIVGSGVIGLTHAWTAIQSGRQVTILERNTRPLGASVRNFGTIWPVGLAFGPERDQALYGAQRWLAMAQEAGFWAEPCGSLSIACRPEAWQVLQEFASLPDAQHAGFELLSPTETLLRCPLANPHHLQGSLFSPHEVCLKSASALATLKGHLQTLGVRFEYQACAIKVHDDAVELADGRSFPFDHCVIAVGDEMSLLFPNELAQAGLRKCQLQMMRTSPLPSRIGAILVSDLTLAHYPAFQDCQSVPKLKSVLHDGLPDHQQWGVHVIVAQHEDGSVTLGDSHEYGPDFTPELWSHVESLVLSNLATFTRLPHYEITARWHGTYLKSTRGQTQVVLHPRERVTMVTAMGGLGMTLSWGLAEKTVAAWDQRQADFGTKSHLHPHHTTLAPVTADARIS